MTTVTVEHSKVGAGFPLPAEAGQVVSVTVPAGCVLRRSTDFVNYSDVTDPLPHTHAGPRASYRIDCDTYTAPVTAVLTIT